MQTMEPALDANKGKAVVHVLACVLEKLVAANNSVSLAHARVGAPSLTPFPPRMAATTL